MKDTKKARVKVKKVKKYTAKKVPSLFKKTYSEQKFTKEIEKRLLVVSDRNYIVPLFKKDENNVYKIPKETEFTKKDLLRLKTIAKQIKMQKKWRVNIIPLTAVVCVAAVIVAGIFIFKDFAVKKAITSGLEGVFGAKCDISKVSVDIFGSRILINQISQADKNNPFTNIFEIDTIDIDFDLTQLLKKKFVADTIEFAGISYKTAREKDGTLFKKEKKLKEPKKESINEANEEKKPSIENLPKKQIDLDSVTKLFEQYDPEKLVKAYYAAFKSPAAAQKVQNEVQAIIPRWESTPSDLKELSARLINEGQVLLSIDIQSLKTQPDKIPDAVSSLANAYEAAKEAQITSELTIVRMRDEAALVAKLSDSIKAAVTSDMNLLKNDMDKIKSFKFDDAKTIVTDGISGYLKGVLGNYYPYVVTGIDVAQTYLTTGKKAEPSAKSKEDDKKARSGRIIYYKENIYPSLLIKNVHISGGKGNLGIEGRAQDISNDMQKWGKPMKSSFVLSIGNLKNDIRAVVDLRESSDSLLEVQYSGSGIPVNTNMQTLESVPGLPIVTGNAAVKTMLLFNSQDSFDVSGSLLLDPASITAVSFKPDYLFSIYQDALARFKSLNADFTGQLRGQGNFTFTVESLIDKQFSGILSSVINDALKEIKELAIAEAQTYLNDFLNQQIPAIDDFNTIMSSIEMENSTISTYRENLEKKIIEMREGLTGVAEAGVLNLLNTASVQVNTGVDQAKQAAEAETERLKAAADAEKNRLLKEAEAEAARKKAEAEVAAKKAAEEAAKKAAEEAAKKAQNVLPKLW